MKNRLLFLFLLMFAAQSQIAIASAVSWKCSTESRPWVDQPDVQTTTDFSQFSGDLISVDSTQKFQNIDGWGGCFNERGWQAMQVLPEVDRQRVLQSVFGADGLNLNLCRTPIGSSDYAIKLYSLDETPGDYSMQHFSIDRDKEKLIPYIKAAMAIRPDLRIWGVPWSPPSWMKDSNRLDGGSIKADDKTFDALALYFEKYVQAYRAEGLPLYMVMPQNEPSYSNNYSSCKWDGKQLANFIGKHLGPLFQRDKLDCEIYLGTLARSDPENYLQSVAPSLDSPTTSAFITGLGCQWFGDQVMRDTQFLHPEKKLMQTENECGEKNTNDWAFAIHQFDRAKTYFNSGANVSLIWNILLDQTGLSTAGWAQCSPIVIDQISRKVIYTPYYYCYKHFSAFVKPNARRIAIEGAYGTKLAFNNPDGTVIVVLANTSAKDLAVNLCVDHQLFKAILPAKSFNTMCVPASR